ncbi:MAG: class I SAM-dependent methyltransferase [Solirubrobacteraceae bacterium]
MSTSLIYRSATGYELLMRALYGRHYAARLRAVADQIRPGASVLELCPGPGALFERHLRDRAGTYTGVDVNEAFVQRLGAMGADALRLDLNQAGELPEADVVIMQASLYHFLPNADAIVERMLVAARERVIVAEPIRNVASSRLPVLALLGRRGTDPGAGEDSHAERFNEQTLDRLMERYAPLTVAAFKIPGGREKVFVLDRRRG